MVSSRETGANTVVLVHHAGDAIEAEAVKLVFLHPKAQVAHEEPQNLVMAIIEQTAVPEFVASPCTLMEVLVV